MYYSHVFYSNAKTSWRASYTPDIVYATSDNPTGVLRQRQLSNIPLCLLERGQKCSVRLLNAFSQVFADTLLLDHYFR